MHVARIIHVIQIGYDQTSVQVYIDRFADGGGIVETQVRDLRRGGKERRENAPGPERAIWRWLPVGTAAVYAATGVRAA